MRQTFTFAAVAALTFAAVGFALAKPVSYELPAETAQLRPGPGLDTAQNNCLACHSADYMAMQPPKKGKPFWEAEVVKMIKTYKAPISDDDAKVIADYLAAAY
ncbi:cytochrome c [Alsobacter sp. SYSU M60028]|uniref:Cytochrome c n=1 Tax=Alsobacter ponti TaxID=2962936 RepID=A0ABT1LF65_9HYPH|nr:cytochrome c [Alsobacter ponti]MCP8940137.1 cytochrome c [Alsobacter ponti]